MPNRAYIGIWTSGHSEDVMLDRFERLLETVPLSQRRPGFTSLEIRAVSASEAPLVEQDLRGVVAGAADVIALAREHRNADTSYEVQGYWDLWQCDVSGLWQRHPERLLLVCNGPDYDEGIAADAGHFVADIGLEHLFTGDGGLLGSQPSPPSPRAFQDPAEAQVLALTTQEESLFEYREKTRENVQQLLDWVRALQAALPVERLRLVSEGERDFEARLDDIVSLR
jgi:hypothetical protein